MASVLVGGCCIDDVQRLRSGSAAAVLPFAPLAPSTLGTFLRSFTFGHVRQLDKALESAQMRAWSVGAAPSVAEMTVDLDSTVCEVCGKAKHGAGYGHTKVLGYHPLVAVRSDTGEVLHSRMRSGSSQRGNVHFARETLARVRRLAAHAAVTVRADAGFFSYDMIAAVGAHNACYSITIPQNAKVKAAIAAIDDDWAPIAYTRGGEAQVAETTIEAGHRGDKLHGGDDAPAKFAATAPEPLRSRHTPPPDGDGVSAFSVWAELDAGDSVFCLDVQLRRRRRFLSARRSCCSSSPERQKVAKMATWSPCAEIRLSGGTILRGLPPERSVVRCLGVRGHSPGPTTPTSPGRSYAAISTPTTVKSSKASPGPSWTGSTAT